ncbi:queuosine biosynthesis protein QueD [Vibrio metoecus]|uniref:Queuosine biosynthesis protein QueD n=1 Tax=Vibrio metoecus TaxID=1481663 RepID=A0A0Q0Q2A3_VIBMT|nr:VC2046/SO_2500 family protein [Vibrio metoecus]KQA99801.1 queuosine biosynthesis protein QueD [Vibrio metoecus]
MQVHTLDKAGIISELHFGQGISQAVTQGRRADFALLLALFSNDVRDNTPIDKIHESPTTEQVLRQRFELAEPQPLENDESSYQISAKQAALFHEGGIASAKLSHYLTPEALTYRPQDTQGFPEEVYLNLSGHERRHLAEKTPTALLAKDFYHRLATAYRQDQFHLSI